MSNGTQNWRPEITGTDYFGHQKKQLQVADRRPVIRRASDLVGPGINSTAVRITDFNDPLATFNGYYSADVGALNAPNSDEPFVGQTISDATLGGRQVFTGLVSGAEFARTFVRSPTDSETLGWGNWSGQRIPASASGYAPNPTTAHSGWPTILAAPVLDTIGSGDAIYAASSAGVRIQQQGVYTGRIQIAADTAVTADVTLKIPSGDTTISVDHDGVPIGPTRYFPFTVWVTNENQGISVIVTHSVADTDIDFWWTLAITRTGDAI